MIYLKTGSIFWKGVILSSGKMFGTLQLSSILLFLGPIYEIYNLLNF